MTARQNYNRQRRRLQATAARRRMPYFVYYRIAPERCGGFPAVDWFDVPFAFSLAFEREATGFMASMADLVGSEG